MKAAITFEQFEIGKVLGSIIQVVDREMIDRWRELYQDEDIPESGELSSSIVQALVMRSFLTVVEPRPPGNIHVTQSLSISNSPRLGEPIHVSVTCADKVFRKQRRYVSISVSGCRGNDEPLFEGLATLIWAG